MNTNTLAPLVAFAVVCYFILDGFKTSYSLFVHLYRQPGFGAFEAIASISALFAAILVSYIYWRFAKKLTSTQTDTSSEALLVTGTKLIGLFLLIKGLPMLFVSIVHSINLRPPGAIAGSNSTSFVYSITYTIMGYFLLVKTSLVFNLLKAGFPDDSEKKEQLPPNE